MLTLSIDIGGSGIKMLVLDTAGQPVCERVRVPTPRPAAPDAVEAAIEVLARQVGPFDRVSVGFPGIVRNGVTWSAHNLDPAWLGFPLAERIEARFERPTRVLNDADMQGYAVIAGRGVELVLTLGTGFGSALFVDGTLVPNLELAHHPYRGRDTYEDRLGDAAMKAKGVKRWNRRLGNVVGQLERTFNHDVLYLGGGNARKVTLEPSRRLRIVSNLAGLLGGIACWNRPTGAPAAAEDVAGARKEA